MALHHAVCVHDPAHDFFIGVHIRGGNVLIGADEGEDHSGIPPGETAALSVGDLVHIHIDAAISSPIGDVHQSALQSGQSGQSLDFVLADTGVKAYAAFAGAPQGGVLHPIALKQAHGAVVHLHRDGNFQLPLRVFHKFICHPVQTHLLGGLVHIVGKILIGIAVGAHRLSHLFA